MGMMTWCAECKKVTEHWQISLADQRWACMTWSHKGARCSHIDQIGKPAATTGAPNPAGWLEALIAKKLEAK